MPDRCESANSVTIRRNEIERCGGSGGVDFAVEDAGVGRDGEEVLKLWGLDELAHEEGGVLVGLVTRRGEGVFGAGELGVDVLVAECGGDWLSGVRAVGEFGVVVDPLPELCAGD